MTIILVLAYTKCLKRILTSSRICLWYCASRHFFRWRSQLLTVTCSPFRSLYISKSSKLLNIGLGFFYISRNKYCTMYCCCTNFTVISRLLHSLCFCPFAGSFIFVHTYQCYYKNSTGTARLASLDNLLLTTVFSPPSNKLPALTFLLFFVSLSNTLPQNNHMYLYTRVHVHMLSLRKDEGWNNNVLYAEECSIAHWL